MPDSNEGKTVGKENDNRKNLDDRMSEATSDETLSEIEDSEKATSSSDTGRDPGPSPDGSLDESDELKNADPM